MSVPLQRIPSADPGDVKIAGLYDLEETIGKGHFAVVKLARHVFTGEKVAVKVIDKNKLDPVSKEHLFQEVMCMKLVKHPNVVRLYEVIDTVNKLYLILELGDGGDLYDYIIKHDSGLNEEAAKRYFAQVVNAIAYCHKLHVCHRDLKPENVVFFEKLGVVKITDFGFSNKFVPGQHLETSCGSLAYSAPEILLGDSYDAPKVDIWSLGVILFMLVCGRLPFQEANDSETLARIMDCKYSLPAHLSPALRDLIGRLLQREPHHRATLDEILRDPWLEGASTVTARPLVEREHVSEQDHEEIMKLMVSGDLAPRDEIIAAVESDEYDHLTATYYLLAERHLRRRSFGGSQSQQNLSALAAALTPPNTAPLGQQQPSLRVPGTPPGQPAVEPTPPTAEEKLRRFSMILEDEEEDMLEEDELSLGEPAPPPTSTSSHRPLLTVKSSPQLLRNIQEDEALEEDRKPGTSRTRANRMTVASPTYLRRLHARRAARAASRQTPSRSSSDNSDNEDGPGSTCSGQARRHLSSARQDSDHSSDTDGGMPPPLAPPAGISEELVVESSGHGERETNTTGGGGGGGAGGKCAPIREEAEDASPAVVTATAAVTERDRGWRRRSESAEATPARSLHKLSQFSLSSSVTQSNFSLSSLASSLRSSKMMVDLFRETLELVGLEPGSEQSQQHPLQHQGVKAPSSIHSYSSVSVSVCNGTSGKSSAQQQASQPADCAPTDQRQITGAKPKPKLACCVLS